jgi:hypothetical protein
MIRRIVALLVLAALGVFPALATHVRASSGSHCSRSKHSCCCKKAKGETTIGAKASCCGHCCSTASPHASFSPGERWIATIALAGSAAPIAGTAAFVAPADTLLYQRPPPNVL